MNVRRDTIGDSPPFPAAVRPVGRLLLRTWSRFPKAPGYLYQTVEKWGARLAAKPIECRLFTGAHVVCDLREQIQRHMYFFGAYEPIEAYLFRALLQPGMIVIDAGANVGQYSLIAAAAVGAGGEVHAFEPVPRNFVGLADHIGRNGFSRIVRLNKMALWHENGPLSLHRTARMRRNAGAYTAGKPSDASEGVMCVASRLDDYVADRNLPHVDVIKMDIEGAEWPALQGAINTLSRWHPMMLMEIHRDACRDVGYEPEQIWSLMRTHGYHAWKIGYSAETSHELSSLGAVDRANVIFHFDPLPRVLMRGWSEKAILRSHRRVKETDADRL